MSGKKPDSYVFNASAITPALAKGKSEPNTPRPGGATGRGGPKVGSRGGGALSYQKCAKPAKISSRESRGSRASIRGDTASRQAKYGTSPPACGRMKRMRE